jgi:catechol 2,3-dioxygenase-like lactoylglutathione lyase family enzyme
MKMEICIDVDDVDRAVEFYSRGLGLALIEHHSSWAQLKLDEQTLWIVRDPTRADLANLSDPAGNGVDLVRRHG